MSPVQVFTALSGATAAFAVLHGLLYVFFPKARANLFYALFTACMTFFYFGIAASQNPEGPADASWWNLYFMTFGLPMMLFGLLFELAAFEQRVRTHTKVLLSFGTLLLVLCWLLQDQFPMMLINLFGMLVSIEMVRVLAVAVIRRHQDAWLVGVGFGVLTVVGISEILVNVGVLRWWTPYALPIGVSALILSMSIYLSRDVARTNRSLEAQLAEVQRLDALTLAREKEAHAAELERQLLEQENRRHEAQLEAARELQLSMLPSSSPTDTFAEIEFEMWTAEQVGGDYYDYLRNRSGELTVAIGDATGHGLNSGLMVASAKSLFQSSAEAESLGATLSRISLGIKSMNLHRMNVAMQLVKIDQDQIELASGGMPPPLIYREATGEVEEVLIPGPPLGAMAGFQYRGQASSWSPGDTILLMSDGLPETVNAAGDVLGYSKVREVFREVARESLTDALDRLHETAVRFAEGHPREDDLTLILLRALDPSV